MRQVDEWYSDLPKRIRDSRLTPIMWQHNGNKKSDSLYYLNNEKNTNTKKYSDKILFASLSNGLKCRKPVFMRASGICFIKWLWFGSICGNNK